MTLQNAIAIEITVGPDHVARMTLAAWPEETIFATEILTKPLVTLRKPFVTLRLANGHAMYRLVALDEARQEWRAQCVESWLEPA